MKRLHDVDLKHLRIFAVVVESGGFTAAENSLNINCSTISKSMSDLETRLGVTLCKRGRSGFELTAEGEKLYQSINKLFSAVGTYMDEVDSLDKKGQRILRIAVVDNTTLDPNCPLVGGLRQLQIEDPNVIIDLQIMTPNEITLNLLKEELDLGITLIHRKVTGLRTTHLYNEQVAPYVATEHEALWRQSKLAMSDIKNLRLTTYTHREPSLLMTSDDSSHFYFSHQMEGVLILILSGNHVGMLPSFYAQHWVETGEIKKLSIDELCLNSPIVTMSKSDGPKQGLVNQLIEIMTNPPFFKAGVRLSRN
jgi:DNA-binding transcriptional LysR family regulator